MTTKETKMFDQMIARVNEVVEEALEEAQEVSATDLGLDRRASWDSLFVTQEFIAVPLPQDRSMQYYGGFEYVNADHRTQVGDWVFYSSESGRVRGHLANVFEDLQEEEEEYEDA
jgi:hypothetical protein